MGVRAEVLQGSDTARPRVPLRLSAALQALEKKAGILFDETKLEHSSQLQQVRALSNTCSSPLPRAPPWSLPHRPMTLLYQRTQLVWRHVEEQLAAEEPEEGSLAAQVCTRWCQHSHLGASQGWLCFP